MPRSDALRIQFHTDCPVSYQEIVAGMCASALLTAATFAVLVPAFPSIPGHWAVYAAGGGVLAVIFYLLLYDVPRKWLTPAISAGTALLFLMRYRAAKNGILLLANDVLRFRTGRSGRIFYYYETAGSAGRILIPCMYMVLFASVSANLMRRRKMLIFPITVLLLLPGFVTGFFESSGAGLLLFSLAAAAGLFSCAEESGKMRGPSANAFSNLFPPAFALLLILLVFGGIRLFAPGSIFNTENAVRRINRVMHALRYEQKMQHLLPEGDLTSPVGPRDETPVLSVTMGAPGKLYLRGFTGDIYEDSVWRSAPASSNIENAARFYTLHENGFYGQTMIAQAAEAAAWSGSDGLQNRSGVSPQGSTDSGAENTDAGKHSADSLYAGLTVENIAACTRYHYVPYGLAGGFSGSGGDPYSTAGYSSDAGSDQVGGISSSDGTISGYLPDPRAIGDASVYRIPSQKAPESQDRMFYIPGGLPAWYEIELALAARSSSPEVLSYLQLEQAYFEYVKNTDLQLPPETAAVMGELFGEEPKERSLSEIIALVRNALDENLIYDETPGISSSSGTAGAAQKAHSDTVSSKSRPESDFISETLRRTRRGDDIHYAACTVAMLRYLGVPARYAEGFFLSRDEAARVLPGEPYALDASHAHAWAEFYLRGIGWIPFETTPGYEDNEELSALSQLTKNAVSASGTEDGYMQTEILYTSGAHSPELLPAVSAVPEILAHPVIFLLLILLFLLTALVLAFQILYARRKRLLTARETMAHADPESAVPLCYSYAKMLMKEAGLQTVPGLEKIGILNEKALFSNHALSEADAAAARAFVAETVLACRRRWNRRENFRNHFIRWIL